MFKTQKMSSLISLFGFCLVLISETQTGTAQNVASHGIIIHTKFERIINFVNKMTIELAKSGLTKKLAHDIDQSVANDLREVEEMLDKDLRTIRALNSLPKPPVMYAILRDSTVPMFEFMIEMTRSMLKLSVPLGHTQTGLGVLSKTSDLLQQMSRLVRPLMKELDRMLRDGTDNQRSIKVLQNATKMVKSLRGLVEQTGGMLATPKQAPSVERYLKQMLVQVRDELSLMLELLKIPKSLNKTVLTEVRTLHDEIQKAIDLILKTVPKDA